MTLACRDAVEEPAFFAPAPVLVLPLFLVVEEVDDFAPEADAVAVEVDAFGGIA